MRHFSTNANVTCNIVCCHADNRGPGDSDEYFKMVVARAEISSSCKTICSAVEEDGEFFKETKKGRSYFRCKGMTVV